MTSLAGLFEAMIRRINIHNHRSNLFSKYNAKEFFLITMAASGLITNRVSMANQTSLSLHGRTPYESTINAKPRGIRYCNVITGITSPVTIPIVMNQEIHQTNPRRRRRIIIRPIQTTNRTTMQAKDFSPLRNNHSAK